MVRHGTTCMNVDTNVFVLAVSQMQRIPRKEVWLSYCTGKKLRYYPIHDIAHSLGPQKSLALPVFHAFIGCDAVSFFANKSKKRAWDTWSVLPEVTKSILEIANVLSKLSADCKRRVPQGFWGNKGTREIWQWEHGTKPKNRKEQGNIK